MKRLVIAALAVLIATGTTALADPNFDSEAINAHCANKWGDDFNMQGHCRKKIITAFVSYHKEKQITEATGGKLIVAYKACETKWGVQWDMVEHCAKKQLEGLYEIPAIANTLPEEPQAVILKGCYDKWHPDFNMIAYCMNKQADAWRELNSGN